MERSDLRSIIVLTCVLAMLASTACSQATDGKPSLTEQYHILSPDSVATLTLQPIARLRLGTSLDDTPQQIADLAVVGAHVFVLDIRRRRLFVYRRAPGAAAALLTNVSSGHELEAPEHFLIRGDSIVIADAGGPGELAIFRTNGAYRSALKLGGTSAPAGVAALENELAVAWAGPVSTGEMAPAFVTILGANHSRVSACPADRRYSNQAEMAAAYAVADVSSDGARFYCVQTISPVILAFDGAGRLVGRTSVAPPFYTMPPRVPRTQRIADLRLFRAAWTAHVRTFPRQRGFLSVYSRYDTVNDQTRYSLFGCEGWDSQSHCAAATVPGIPVAFVAPDTLWLAEPDGGDGPMQLAIVKLMGFKL
jgi:hypothetical protein